MIEGKTQQGGSQDNLVRRGLALVASLLVVLLALWFTIASPAQAGPSSGADAVQLGPPTSESTTTTTAAPTTTKPPPTNPSTTPPPQTTETTEPEEEEPPPTEDTEPEEEEEEEPETTVTTRGDEGGISPLDTTENLLVKGNGIPGSESAQGAPEEEKTTKSGGSSDEDRVIWMIIAGLGAVALLVALLTWRYWLLTRPGIDLSDEDPDDGGFDGGGGYYGGEPPAAPSDPFGAPSPRLAADAPMTSGMPPAPATGWQDPAGPPRQGPQRPPQRRGPERGAAPEPDRRSRSPRRPEADPFPAGPPPAGAPPQRGRSGRGRRGGGDPFWDDVGDQPPRRQSPDQGRRRPEPGDRDPW